MFIDEAEIVIKGGHGGPGKVAFIANKNGPSGGDGGKGGDVYAIVDNNVNDLKKYVKQIEYQAENGKSGDKNKKHGADGEDLHLQLPIGTTIINLKTKEETELNKDNTKVLICRGGNGGLGNDYFKTSTNRTPTHAEPGNIGEEKHLRLILKLFADYGLIGLPNAGKSSLLNALTRANVRTAAYPFTTLEPNLGTYSNKIIADIPGLIEGASHGRGLGIKFLKHIEKVKLLLHCVSVESEDIEKEYEIVRNELSIYSQNLALKKTIILLTKTDLTDTKGITEKTKRLKKINNTVIPVSIYNERSLDELRKVLI